MPLVNMLVRDKAMLDHADAFIATIDRRVSEIVDRCTRCALVGFLIADPI
jgi:hypothetical protein